MIQKKQKKHKRYPISDTDGLTARFCLIQGHEDLQLSAFCQNCSKLVCSNCIIEEHKLHASLNIKVAVETTKTKLTQTTIVLTKDMQNIIEEIKGIEKQLQEKKEKLHHRQQIFEHVKDLIKKSNEDEVTFLSRASKLKLPGKEVISEDFFQSFQEFEEISGDFGSTIKQIHLPVTCYLNQLYAGMRLQWKNLLSSETTSEFQLFFKRKTVLTGFYEIKDLKEDKIEFTFKEGDVLVLQLRDKK